MTDYIRHCPHCGFIAPGEGVYSCPTCSGNDPERHHGLVSHRTDDGPLMTPAEAKAMLRRLSAYYGDLVMPMKRYCTAFERWLGAIEALNKRPLRAGEKAEYKLGHSWFKEISGILLAIRKSSLLGRLLYEGEMLRTEECPVHKGKWSGMEHPENPCPHGCGFVGWLPQPNDPLHITRKAAQAELEAAPIFVEKDARERAEALVERGAGEEEFLSSGFKLGRSSKGALTGWIFYRDSRAPYGWRALAEPKFTVRDQ